MHCLPRAAARATASPCKPTSTGRRWRCTWAACEPALVYLPLNTGYQRSELDYFFADAQPRVIVCSPDNLGLVATLARDATVLTLDAHGGELIDRANAFPATFDTVVSAPNDLAAILYTSGTTGRSKGAMLTHRNLASNALALVEAWGFTRGDVLLHALPIYHVHGLFVAIHCVLLSGAHMMWLPKFDAKEAVQSAAARDGDDGRADVLRAAACRAVVHAGIAVARSGCSCRAPHHCCRRPSTHFVQRTGQTILERYGMTETGMNTSNPLRGRPRRRHRRQAAVRRRRCASSAMMARHCNRVRVGAVHVRGPNVFVGYWKMPEKTREEFTADGYFRTGDMGEWVADGPGQGYLRLVGRAKDLIITGGLNVYPKEIEERIDAHGRCRRDRRNRRARSGFRRERGSGHRARSRDIR